MGRVDASTSWGKSAQPLLPFLLFLLNTFLYDILQTTTTIKLWCGEGVWGLRVGWMGRDSTASLDCGKLLTSTTHRDSARQRVASPDVTRTALK